MFNHLYQKEPLTKREGEKERERKKERDTKKLGHFNFIVWVLYQRFYQILKSLYNTVNTEI